MKEEIKQWLDKAENDIELAKYDIKGAFYEDACFHCQQAAEKAIKAAYIKKFKNLLKIHDVRLLAKKVGAPEELIDIGDELNAYYIITRYPALDNSPTEEDAEEMVEKAKKVLEWVKKTI